MRSALFALALALVIGCDGSPAPATKTAAPEKAPEKTAAKAPEKAPPADPPPIADKPAPADESDGLVWTIDAKPTTVTIAKLPELELAISVTNGGAAITNAMKEPMSFTVDGASSTSLSLAFNNGGREAMWTKLPPGKTLHTRRVGVAFIDAPGDHVIAVLHGTREIAKTTVHVDK